MPSFLHTATQVRDLSFQSLLLAVLGHFFDCTPKHDTVMLPQCFCRWARTSSYMVAATTMERQYHSFSFSAQVRHA